MTSSPESPKLLPTAAFTHALSCGRQRRARVSYKGSFLLQPAQSQWPPALAGAVIGGVASCAVAAEE